MADRRDPVQAWSRTAVAAATAAGARDARATFGRLEVRPNSTNAVPSQVRAWLDARAADEQTLQALLDDVRGAADEYAQQTGTTVDVATESLSPVVIFDIPLRARIAAALETADSARIPVLPTAAGHDAGVLSAAGVPTAMLFVRNPTGVSHSPAEYAERDDCLAGVVALTRTIESLAC
jgi:N-carbamoyl-L-amino-acid hydrolase